MVLETRLKATDGSPLVEVVNMTDTSISVVRLIQKHFFAEEVTEVLRAIRKGLVYRSNKTAVESAAEHIEAAGSIYMPSNLWVERGE